MVRNVHCRIFNRKDAPRERRRGSNISPVGFLVFVSAYPHYLHLTQLIKSVHVRHEPGSGKLTEDQAQSHPGHCCPHVPSTPYRAAAETSQQARDLRKGAILTAAALQSTDHPGCLWSWPRDRSTSELPKSTGYPNQERPH